MHRPRPAWLLLLLLVIGQHGALVHGLSHAYYSARDERARLVAGQALDAGQCVVCQAYSQVSNPVGSALPNLPASPHAPPRARGADAAARDTDTPTPRSRGPPALS